MHIHISATVCFCLYVFFLDVDECATQRGLCRNGQCVNTVGAFFCICNDGYELTLDGRVCSGNTWLFKINNVTFLFGVT